MKLFSLIQVWMFNWCICLTGRESALASGCHDRNHKFYTTIQLVSVIIYVRTGQPGHCTSSHCLFVGSALSWASPGQVTAVIAAVAEDLNCHSGTPMMVVPPTTIINAKKKKMTPLPFPPTVRETTYCADFISLVSRQHTGTFNQLCG